MKAINLTTEMREAVQRCVWFEPPEQAIKDVPRLAAYILTYGLPKDTKLLLEQLSDDGLKQVLDNAPAGIYDNRSWAYWNLMIGRTETPPLPERQFIPINQQCPNI